MSLSTNLVLSGIGLTTVGGIITGGYIFLKDNPRKITEFLKVKKRIMLSKTEDVDAWNKNWAEYVKDNTPKPQPSGDGAQVQATVDESKNNWNLSNYIEKKKKPNEAPDEFKDECISRANKEVSGIWQDEFKKVEKYCTKEETDDN
ncbi:hypothetical protein A6V39_04975 [Candidatus Mycoplasma haematobovis]|uniref:Uncharacterized protein n=1 Tax=Candidatus Mycoplasma haematobovis TaxID=432608 RepID=A0A1A9QDK3_9MOLU|nr:hypothetical protein [Candidatus Mycoplasma haematobovis]OAL09780.1 hypothetical protein A6V39_04975 [Candidatus Mycoplasma haematobovis]